MVSIMTSEYRVKVGDETIGFISVYGNLEYQADEALIRWCHERGCDASSSMCKRLGDFYGVVERALGAGK